MLTWLQCLITSLLSLLAVHWIWRIINRKSKKLHARVVNAIVLNDILAFKKLFEEEIQLRDKRIASESSLVHLRRMRNSGNVSGRKDFSLMNNYFHFLVGYDFDEREKEFTRRDMEVVRSELRKGNVDLEEYEYEDNGGLLGEGGLEGGEDVIRETSGADKHSEATSKAGVNLLGGPTNPKTSQYNIVHSLITQSSTDEPARGMTPEETLSYAQLVLESRDFFKDFPYSFEQKYIYLMLQHGMQIDCVDNAGRTPLFIACYLGKVECINKLLAKDASLTKKNSKFMNLSPLTALVLKRRFRILVDLLNQNLIQLDFLINELEILNRQKTIRDAEFQDAMRVLEPFLMKKQIINFLHERKKIKYLRPMSEEKVVHFIHKYVIDDDLRDSGLRKTGNSAE